MAVFRCFSHFTRGCENLFGQFNLRSAFPYLVDNSFKRPITHTVIMENGMLYKCGRCIEINGLCGQCGYFCTCEYSLAFSGNPLVLAEMLLTYTKYM